MKQGQEDVAAKVLKRVRHDKPYAFRRKGNEEQASFNGSPGQIIGRPEFARTQASAGFLGPRYEAAGGVPEAHQDCRPLQVWLGGGGRIYGG